MSIPVVLYVADGMPQTYELEDTPESRGWLESYAIPKCYSWREINREDGNAAPYCPSAYCPRCAGMRALDGEEPLTPNEWMTR
jgi:hypothetical protein